MIALRDVSKTYRLGPGQAIHAVRGVTLDVCDGEFLVITGRSGSGKTTLLNLIAGTTRPTSGRVYIDGRDLWSLPDRQQSRLRSQKIGFVFQFPSLLPALTVIENVALPALFGRGVVDEETYARARELLDLVGLADRLDAFPRQLSAGQQQRVVVARALVNRPALLLADEPTSDLDEQTEGEIMELFRTVHAQAGLTVLLVTHASALVSYGTRSVRMAGGLIVDDPAQGQTPEAIRAPAGGADGGDGGRATPR